MFAATCMTRASGCDVTAVIVRTGKVLDSYLFIFVKQASAALGELISTVREAEEAVFP